MSTPEITCKVCGTRQPNAWDCSVCGRPLHERPKSWQVPVETVEGLEPTHIEAAELNVFVETLPELETTSVDDGFEPLPDEIEGLETTALFDDLPELPPQEVPGLERTGLGTGEEPAFVAAEITCRYCGTPWQGGSRLCERCGMRLSVPTLAAPPPQGEVDHRACRACGAGHQAIGGPCSSCGQLVL